MRIVFSILLLWLLLANFGFAATANEATLQITGYSVMPSKVYPGTRGYIQLTLQNSGTGTASGIKLDYSDNYNYRILSMYLSDINSGANSQVSIPFEVPSEFSTGIILYKIEIYYFTVSGGGSSKTTTFSVPIQISQNEILQVDTLSVGNNSVFPGDRISLSLGVRNTGGTINDLSVSCPQNSSFSIDGSTSKHIGSIAIGSNRTISLNLISSSTASVGQYLIPLTFTYQDALQNPVTQTLYVGPVNVLDASSQFKVSLEPISSTEIGSAVDFKLSLENNGASTTSAIIIFGSTSVFTPLGERKLYFSSIEPGKNVSDKVTIGISASVSSGYYELPINVTLSTGRSFTQTIGIHVQATPEIKITGELSASTTGNEIIIQISNTGNTPIRSVYAIADMGGSRTEKFIGTLDIDDYSTLSIPISLGLGNFSNEQTATPGGGPQQFNRTSQFNRTAFSGGAVKVTVSFKDEQNQPHTIIQNVNINTASARQTGSFNFNLRSNGNQGIIFGLGAIQLGGITLVIVAIVYYLYRRRKRKKLIEE